MIDQSACFEIPIKNKKETYEAATAMFNDTYITGNLLDHDYFLNHYKLIAINLSKKNVNLNKKQVNLIGRLEQNATVFFIIENYIIINGQNNGQYGKGDRNDSTIKFNAEVLKPNVCDTSDAYVLVTGVLHI